MARLTSRDLRQACREITWPLAVTGGCFLLGFAPCFLLGLRAGLRHVPKETP